MFKRGFDLILCLISAPIWLPLFAALWVTVLFVHGRPVLFTQSRGGRGGRVFKLYKFRSMTDERDHAGDLLPDNQRLTAFGRLLRQHSLDELPSLINLLKGDISIIGPRPFMAEYLSLYTAEQARRHEVRPGITGWAQVNGRNALSWEEKFALDVWYVDNQSFWLDVKILFLTVVKVFQREGVSADGVATMPKFTGSRPDNSAQ